MVQYTKQLTFAQCVEVMSEVVFKTSRCAGSWYQTHQDELSVTRQALVYYDPQYDRITDIFPCEDAHAQERSLLTQVLERIAAQDCVLADRGAFFIIGQHKATLSWELRGERRCVGLDAQGRRVYEQAVRLTDKSTGQTLRVRRITIELRKPTKRGETEIHLLTNVPVEEAEALQIAIGPEDWAVFRTMTPAQFAETLRPPAQHMDLRKYTKHKRGPKKKPPQKISGKRHHHVSTARILALRARK